MFKGVWRRGDHPQKSPDDERTTANRILNSVFGYIFEDSLSEYCLSDFCTFLGSLHKIFGLNHVFIFKKMSPTYILFCSLDLEAVYSSLKLLKKNKYQ